MHTQTDRAERMGQRRSIVAIVLGTLLIVTQGQRMDDGGAGPVGWAVTGGIIAIFLLWASGLFHAPALRGILNDESSDASRKRSLTIAFWNMLATAVVCYLLTYVRDFGPRDAIQIIMTVGISSALISFGIAERFGSRA